MSGRLQEISFSELKERQQSTQASLDDYATSDTTYVAVVSLPTGNIEDIADEVWESLGMPEKALKNFLARRSGYRSNSAIDKPHNQAYADIGLTEIYRAHIEESDAATRRISDATERLVSGENITLVCYEPKGKECHRHLLIDMIEQEVESRENCKFTLSA